MEQAVQDLEDIYDEYHLVDEIASITVLEKELERCKGEAKKAGLKNKPLLKFFLDRCDFIKIQIENIEGECESGDLTPEGYMEKVQEYI